MDWTAIKVITSSEAVEAVSYILTDMGAQGVQIEDAADFENLDEGLAWNDCPQANRGEINATLFC